MADTAPTGDRSTSGATARDRVERLRCLADLARERAEASRSTVTDLLVRERAAMQQHRVDTEVSATERLLDTLAVPGRTRYPGMEALDPYFLASTGRARLLNVLLDTAVAGSSADMGNVQLFDPARSELRIAACRGFDQPFPTLLESVVAGGTAATAAVIRAEAVLVHDIAHSQVFDESSRTVLLDAHAYAVLSLPMITTSGRIVGVLSCHYESANTSMEHDELLFALLADAGARSLQWQDRRPADSRFHARVADLNPLD
ncbi:MULTISPECIES: GAF domain-containing protein [unclassified Nocardia]|uniref:GAF domain-containing protein n=1 Tax=unclassified Nocardia TaxID=2637762 RepID=UPI0024A94C72|nr:MULTISPECIES: GAF domain-containing protein [unclassified Nocardia]